jgi:hypothetical protein
MFAFIDRWFEPVTASQDYRQGHYLVLALVIVAGVWLRFWHLDNVGLHGDEDIMGLAARGIVAQGIPVLPSDMVYWRAPLHTYLLAGSTMLFGDTEWALRMPSAVVGSLCGLLAFFVGRRFLDPVVNVGFVAAVTFLPAMIEISLSARMYVFLIAFLLIFAILLFRWERSRSNASFVWTFLTLIVAIQFHRLAVFAAPMLLYPGLANKSLRQTLLGGIGVALTVAFSEWMGDFANQDYPDDSERLELEGDDVVPPVRDFVVDNIVGMVIGSAMICGLVAFSMAAKLPRSQGLVVATLCAGIGSIACAFLHYHVGVIALLCAALVWVRAGIGQLWRLLVIVALFGVIAVIQSWALVDNDQLSGRNIVGAFIGTPSVWPTIRFLGFSPAGAVILALALAVALYEFANNRRVPLYFAFFAISVWVALFGIGAFKWYTATRYTLGPLPFFLLAVFAGVSYLVRIIGPKRSPGGVMRTVLVTATVVLATNPFATWRIAENSYDDLPDHKGAAEFVESLELDDQDVIVAEDSIVQTYYLGKVDYRLQSVQMAAAHSFVRSGNLLGQYTGTQVIGSGQELLRVFDSARSHDVFIISSSQSPPGLERRNRANGISAILSSDRLSVVYEGRDRKTKVWKLRKISGST